MQLRSASAYAEYLRIQSLVLWFQVDFEVVLESPDKTVDVPLSGVMQETRCDTSDFIQRDSRIDTASWHARGVVVPASFAKVR